jgi:hypothetical protein
MIELIICAVAIILATIVSVYQIRNDSAQAPESAYADAWWWMLPM